METTSKYIIYDRLLNITKIDVGSWKCLNIIDPDNKNSFNPTICKIADPRGKIEGLSLEWDEKAVLEVIKMLNKYSKYKSWEEYEIVTENEELKENNKLLREELMELRKENSFYEQTLKNILDDLPKDNIEKLSNYNEVQKQFLEQKLNNFIKFLKVIWRM